MQNIAVIGGGLAGCETAWQLAGRGVSSTIFEMKPERFSPAHENSDLGELVCSNSFRSMEEATGIGLLQREMSELGSLVMEAALKTRVPAGKALAVDRLKFARYLSSALESLALVTVKRKEICSLDDPELSGFDAVVLAAGPLMSDPLAQSLSAVIGEQSLYFYDAIAPIVSADSIDMTRTYWGSRYRPGDDDYLNCPMTREEYLAFYRELTAAATVPARDFEQEIHFEGCMPIEAMAGRGEMTMAFGPLKPVGLPDPKTGQEPFAVVQLRAENLERTAFNLVGFQTRLKYPEQKRVFAMIPGLEQAEFLRLGSMHRNTFVNAPRVLAGLELKARPGVFLAGQITGVEGYLESAAMGLWLGKSLGTELPLPPRDTALGALLHHLEKEDRGFQPSNVNFGLFPGLNIRAKKARRKELHAERARKSFHQWCLELPRTELEKERPGRG
ncbi:methylenetetrahydrofolate--tRNA-(uracil(54)-C(5))-methyltransferase (FADH(2)-oxidizing) TrmFO [Desulfonatronovibrio hydrogenovorans]|uniref:methylenetetrahydrofolate--tRNA-(uracil(54)- C(5))-methyltransferase (FADH(2)-oxidizing) TrmFO n=1 Tax=Desulfonatronovibrio hydrogenovorans TaxID=53245 RepID=UPI00048D9C5B|nr:methylenetetrahydrofolate--tRNA-(uracil(54)-C(5))-methyltransferase (FADH(2)-oxidizing) TrmFO [Desulfonatronovibrio hydrogenovorans]